MAQQEGDARPSAGLLHRRRRLSARGSEPRSAACRGRLRPSRRAAQQQGFAGTQEARMAYRARVTSAGQCRPRAFAYCVVGRNRESACRMRGEERLHVLGRFELGDRADRCRTRSWGGSSRNEPIAGCSPRGVCVATPSGQPGAVLITVDVRGAEAEQRDRSARRRASARVPTRPHARRAR